MLFNLKEDPHQQYDLKKEYPELCAVGAKILLDWQDDMMASSESIADSLWVVLQEVAHLIQLADCPNIWNICAKSEEKKLPVD